MMPSSRVAGTAAPAVAGTAAFLFAYRLYGITCAYTFSPPSCANSNGRLFVPVSDFRPTWLAAALAGLAVAWLTHLAIGRWRPPRDRLQLFAAFGLAAVVPLLLQWQGAEGHLAAWAALALPFFAAPFALGMGLARRGSPHPRDVLVAVITTAGAGIAATVTVLWATHRLWGTVRTPHLLLWTVALAPCLAIAAMLIRAGAAARSRMAGSGAVEASAPASTPEPLST